SFFFGQARALIVAVMAGSWGLIRRAQPWVAGLPPSLLLPQPQLPFLVPPALSLAGRGRVRVSWLLGTAVLGAAALLMRGLSVVVLAGWLVLQTRPRRWGWLMLFGVYVAVYLAPVWPVLTVTALSLWLISLLTPWASTKAIDQPVTQAGAAAA